MAEVFLGSTVGAEGFTRRVAIKRVLPGYSENEAFARMFVAEARISSQLVHPNIVSVLDFDRDPEGRLFLVMELVDGKDLDALVSTGVLPYSVIIFVISEVLRGLGHAHDLPVGNEARGVIHRDISPHNVLLSWAGAVKVSDFGIAKARAASEATASEFIKGKPAYMSPEQANGQPLDGRSDLFAVGIMLWEMVMGRRLFVGEDMRSTLAAVLFGQIPRPRSLRGDVPKDLERVTMKLLERDVPARYATAEEAVHDLLECADAPRAGREALVAALAERFPGQAPMRQSLLRQQLAGGPSSQPPLDVYGSTRAATPPDARGVAALSLGSMRNAPTGTLERTRTTKSRLPIVLAAAVLCGVIAFGIVLAAKRGGGDDGSQVAAASGSGPSGSAVTVLPVDAAAPTPPPPIDAAPVTVDAAPPVDAGVPVDAKKDAPPPQTTETRVGSLFVQTEPIVTIYVDGKHWGDSPRTIPNLRVGRHSVLLKNPDADIKKTLSVTIKPNETYQLKWP
jgi:hypothetical protein